MKKILEEKSSSLFIEGYGLEKALNQRIPQIRRLGELFGSHNIVLVGANLEENSFRLEIYFEALAPLDIYYNLEEKLINKGVANLDNLQKLEANSYEYPHYKKIKISLFENPIDILLTAYKISLIH
ncbi:MAG: hypothetical protein QXX55_01250 [Candidatus Pacearchaeota archaeon]